MSVKTNIKEKLMYGEKYGVPRDIYAKIKIIGLLILDITFVGITGLIALSVGLRIFPKKSMDTKCSHSYFLTPVMSLYLVLPANGGKKNWHSMFLFFRRRRKRYISLNYIRRRKS